MLTYLPVWNGALDRAERCPSLSTYLGHSPLASVIERQDSLSAEPTLRGRMRGPARHARGEYDAAITRGLQRGVSYRVLCKQFHLSMSVVRRVAKALARG